ncbi:MAG: type II secretion system protein GspD [Planctomycetota bacterium]|jgi:hypothetical protein
MRFRKTYLIVAIGLCLTMGLSGCGDFFEKMPTDLESRAVLRDIAQVRENPHVDNPLPDVYTAGPQRLAVEDGVKLFYFTKYLPVGDPSYKNPKNKALETQTQGFAGTIQQLGFKVSANPSTNQMVIHCADDAECGQILSYLKKTDVPPIQIHIDCLILERFGDVTQDWETTILIENFLGEGITLGEAKFPNAAFPGAALRETRRGEFGLDIGYWINKGVPGHQVRAVVDLLESRGYLKILMNPTLETVNGKESQVRITDRAPIERTVTERDRVYTVTDYKDVSDMLTVTPYVYADGSIGLKTNITIGSSSKPEGVVQTPIITERSIDVAENRIEPGKSLVIGGMRKSENRSVIRGVPFFKDLPLVGVLFSSKDFEEKATEIVFILTPSISSGGVDYATMAEIIREKYETPDFTTEVEELVSDPLGTKVYSELVQDKTLEAESETIRVERQIGQARRQAQTDRLRAEQAILDSQMLRMQAQEIQAQIDQSKAEKKASQAQADAAAKEAKARQAILTQTQAEADKAVKEAKAAGAKAVKSQEALQTAQQRTEALQRELEKVQAEAAGIEEQLKQMQKEKSAPDESEGTTETP